MPPALLSHAEWLKRTASLGRSRSDTLRAVDAELLRYERDQSDAARKRVAARLEVWKKSHGIGDEWKKSTRNRSQAVEHLSALLGAGDTDAAFGNAEAFMHADLAHARLGVLYLFGHTTVAPDIFSVVLEGGMAMLNGVVAYAGTGVADGGLANQGAKMASVSINPCMVAGNQFIAAGRDATPKPPHGTDPSVFAMFANKVRAWFEAFTNKLLETVKEKFLSLELPLSAIKSVVLAVCNAVLSTAAAGIVSGSMDLAKGVVNTLDAAMTRFRAWKMGNDVEMAGGHPTTVVDAIRRAMTLSLFEGLWQTLKGAGNLALVAGTAAAGMIASIVIAGAEAITKIVWRLVEAAHMTRFVREAATHWKGRDASDALHTQPFAFSHWYREYALNCPSIAALTLNSGVCGDKMVYLAMYRTDKSVITPDEFTAGAAFVDSLKPWGADYLKRSGYAFTGSTEMVNKLLNFAQSHSANENVVWGFVKKLANA